MYTKIRLSIFMFCVSLLTQAQSITIEFPKFAGKTYDFIIFQGDNMIKLHENDSIPKTGIIKIEIPKEYAPYTGMCRWLITNTAEGGGLDMAVPGYGFSVSCLSNTPNVSNIKFDGFDAMNELNRLNREQQIIIDKFETISKATRLYDAKHPLNAIFNEEKNAQQQSYLNFRKALKDNPNHNARFLPIVSLLAGNAHKLTDVYEEKATYTNEFIVSELNYDDLYTSGHWTNIIQSWVQLHAQMLANKENFVQDFNTISRRIADPKKYTDFVGKVTYYLTQAGKDNFIEGIATSVVNSGKITSYEGKTMQVYVSALIGTQAPNLEIREHIGKNEDHNYTTTILKSSELATGSYQKSLLIFYQSGCGFCEELMQQLPQNYEMLREKGFRIISVSSDNSEQVFKDASKNYPWPDKFCDYEGSASVNFKNYAVLGTPTIYLLNKAGKIEAKLISMQEILQLVN